MGPRRVLFCSILTSYHYGSVLTLRIDAANSSYIAGEIRSHDFNQRPICAQQDSQNGTWKAVVYNN